MRDELDLAHGAELVHIGERMARDYLKALACGLAAPGQLPADIAALSTGARNTLYGYTRVIEKALLEAQGPAKVAP